MFKLLSLLYAFQIASSFAGDVVVGYRFSTNKQVHNVEEARKLLATKTTRQVKIYNVAVEAAIGGVNKFTHNEGKIEKDENKPITERGVSLTGRYFTMRGSHHVTISFWEAEIFDLLEDGTPRFRSLGFEGRRVLDKEGYGLEVFPQGDGTTEVLLIHIPVITA